MKFKNNFMGFGGYMKLSVRQNMSFVRLHKKFFQWRTPHISVK